MPRRGFAAGWHRLLHDGTADEIAAAVGQLAHVNATVVPYQLTGGWLSKRREWRRTPVGRPADGAGAGAVERPVHGPGAAERATERELGPGRRSTGPPSATAARAPSRSARPSGATGSGWRAGSSRCGSSPGPGTSNLECVLADDTGRILLVFQGRRRIPGIQPGARLVVEGMVGDWARRQAILNPDYELIAGPEAGVEPT